MPNIKLTDQLGLDVDAQPAPTSALLKYFQQLPSLRLDSLDLSKVGGLTLEEPALQSLSTGVSFQTPVKLGDGAPSLSVGAGAHASLRIITDVDDLPGHGDEIDFPPNSCYVSFGMDATVSADAEVAAGAIQFGATPSTTLELASYSRFPLHAGVTLLQAVQQTVTGFAVPVKSQDLADLPAGQMVRVALSGTLKLSGSADLLATANPLASANLPAPLPAVSVSAGGSVNVGVSCQIGAEFEIVARKLDNGAVRLAWYREKDSEVSVTVKASEGISAGITGTDLFSQVIGAISSSPAVDLEELAKAGLSADQAKAIQGAVKAAAARKLEIAVGAEISASKSKSAAFLYEIVPAALDDQSRQALNHALRGDLSQLHASGLAGVSCVRSIWDTVRKKGLELDVNLLGILNYRSIATLSLEGTVLFEPATGSMVITDKATAERIRSLQVNFGADTQKLRHVLAESFLITAAYHGAGQVAAAPALSCGHRFFELQNSTNRGDMRRKLQAGVAVGLLSPDEAVVPEGVTDFGRSLFVLSTDYDSSMVTAMFLDADGLPLPRQAYESAGRAAIQFLVQEGDVDDMRRRPAIDDDLWKLMSDRGQPGFPSLFLGVSAPLVGDITADYTVIQWWAEAMHTAAQHLADVRLWMAKHPDADLEDAGFQKLRDNLARNLRQVAATTREEFGQPWGLIAMNQLAHRKGGAKIMVSGPRLSLNKATHLAAVAGL